jgi:hypothetical protein
LVSWVFLGSSFLGLVVGEKRRTEEKTRGLINVVSGA